ncbi:MAG: protein-(glutamine-N5) methyltransferase, ribosomal protein L3-specific [Bradyrhizobium sp.]|nr:protein-(glutamine-N5) methyltransferase, ribosomal protein L3-specific [Bradyrhizobium sp.]
MKKIAKTAVKKAAAKKPAAKKSARPAALEHNTFRQARTQLQTIRDLLRYGVSRLNAAKAFFGHGSADVYDEVAYLILHTLHLPLDLLDPFLDARLTTAELDAVLQVLEKRAVKRVPAAYLTQEAWLGEHRFYVDERVIVPRSFIAELIPAQLEPWLEHPDKVTRILDMCTGSGCLAILLALAFPDAQVDAVDLSPDALAVAARNIADYGLQDRVHLVESNLFAKLKNQRYDLIISNPPYVDAPSMASLPPEFRHEPEMALAGGRDGLDIVRTLLKQADAHLNPGGKLMVEIGHNRDALEAAYPRVPFTWVTVSAGDEFVFMLDHEQLP